MDVTDNGGKEVLVPSNTYSNLLLRTYLHIYLHCSLNSWPFFRSWTSGRPTKYSALEGDEVIEQSGCVEEERPRNEDEGVPLNEDEDDAAGVVATSQRPRSKNVNHYFGKLHSEGRCTWHCTTIHFSVHIGLFLLILSLSGIISFIWAALKHGPLNPNTSVSNPEFDAKAIYLARDYILDPHWNFHDAPKRREYSWTITDEVLNPDGVFRPMMVINKQFPGPLIECNEGDTIAVTILNLATNATSIHWHGLFQNGTNHLDGTIGVTQCPIATDQTYTYEFKVERQSGTYWYHGHFGLQASDGLLGPIVIHSQDEKQKQELEYATDRVLMIQDHYHDLSGALLMEYLQSDGENEEPVPDSSLLNGRNIRNCDDFPLRQCDNSSTSLPDITLDPDQRHRLRIINTGAFAEFEVSIDGEDFQVIEVDGTDVHPVTYNTMRINPAQRYSIILKRKSKDAAEVWFRARMTTSCFAKKNPLLDPLLKAIVRWGLTNDTSTTTLPTTTEWGGDGDIICHDMNTTELVPLDVVPAPSVADHFLYIRSNFEIGAWRLSRGFFNTTSWRPNIQSPLLSRAIDAMTISDMSILVDEFKAVNHSMFDLEHEFVIQTNGVKVIDIAIQNFDDGSHPIHLHGTKYWVLAAGHGHFDAQNLKLDLTNPLRRDTATIEAYGWILIRFIADNPGIWSLHCHNSWHSEAGLLMNFLIKSEIVQTWTLPQALQDLCNAEGVLRGAGPKDDIWFGNTGG